jgi:iron complex outermembrane receptor protein
MFLGKSAAAPGLLLCGVAVLAPRTPALAQIAAKPAVATESIVVTARRRAEKLQKVPVTVTVIGGARIQRDGLNNLQDIAATVPEAQFRTNSTNNSRTLFVRGVGTISTSPGVEPSVSTVVDGVVLARSGQATLDLVDVAQVEVLGGPQGTLFGKNASAGVINITTAQPTPDVHGWGEADYFGSGGDEYRFTGGVTGALAPALSGNLSFLTDGYDGNVRNLYDNKTVNGYRRDAVRGKLRYQPSDALDVTLAVDDARSWDKVPNGVFVASAQDGFPGGTAVPNRKLAALLAAQGILAGANNTAISNNVTTNADDDNGGVALTAAQKLGDYTLTSISAWRLWHDAHEQDYDQTSAPPVGEPQLDDTGVLNFDQLSEEVRLASPKGGLVDYVVGAYGLKTEQKEIYDRSYAPAGTPALVRVRGQNDYGTDGDNAAVFGEANINLTPDFRLIAGARAVHDDVHFYADRVSSSLVAVTGIRPSFVARGSTAHDDYSDRVGAQYDISPDANAYFTYSRGYKGPAYNVFFNMAATDTQALKPETNNSFEVGVKSTWLDGRVLADFSGFIEDFSNYQANFYDLVDAAVVQRLINAGSVTSRGVQANVTARPVERFWLGVNALYDDAYIVRFNCPAQASASCDVNGQPLPFAPRFKLDATAQYAAPLSDRYELRFASDYVWQSKTQNQLSETPDTVQPAYGIWNGSMSLLNTASSWRVSGVMRNITDQHYSSYLAYGDLAGVVRFVPRDNSRYFGVELRKDF